MMTVKFQKYRRGILGSEAPIVKRIRKRLDIGPLPSEAESQEKEISMGAKRFRTIWWTFDPSRTELQNIIIGVGMTKIDFARKLHEINPTWPARTYYREAYGRAHWRITDPATIRAAHKHYGKVIAFDDDRKEVLEVY